MQTRLARPCFALFLNDEELEMLSGLVGDEVIVLDEVEKYPEGMTDEEKMRYRFWWMYRNKVMRGLDRKLEDLRARCGECPLEIQV